MLIVGENDNTRRLYLIDLETLFHLDSPAPSGQAGTRLYKMPCAPSVMTVPWLRAADLFSVGAMFAESLLPDLNWREVHILNQEWFMRMDELGFGMGPSKMWDRELSGFPYASSNCDCFRDLMFLLQTIQYRATRKA